MKNSMNKTNLLIECIICWGTKPKYSDDFVESICKHNICGDCYLEYSSISTVDATLLCPNCQTNVFNPHVIILNALKIRYGANTSYTCIFDSRTDTMTKRIKKCIVYDPLLPRLLIGYEFYLNGLCHYWWTYGIGSDNVRYCHQSWYTCYCTTFALFIESKLKCAQLVSKNNIHLNTIKQPSLRRLNYV